MNRILLSVMVLGLTALTFRCSIAPMAGGGTESTNGRIIGMLMEEDGLPARRTIVMLVANCYDPVKDGPVPDSMTRMTDSLGEYAFAKINNGEYSIIAIHGETRKSAVIRGVQVYDDRTDTAASDTLRAPGSVRVMLPPRATITNGYIFIPGTLTFAFLKDSSDFVMLDSVPAGKAADITYSTTAHPTSMVLRYGVQVKSRDTAVVWNSGWNYSRKITLNTSSSGANVAGNVTDFPVLIRLTADNFDFTQARNGGEDVRFAKSDTTFVPYEIERWDAGNSLAEIWVRVDTVHGGDNAQYIMMYWGNADAASQSNPSAVFDTAAGFAAVWHLSQPAGAIVPDATVNGNHGAVTATTTVPGAIGTAQMFNGVSSLIHASGSANTSLNFSENSVYSVSVWVKADTLDSLYHGIFYKSNRQYGLQIRPENNWEFLSFIQGTGWEGSRCQVSAKSWHLLTGVRRGTQQYLYVDGSCVDSSKVVQSSNLSRVLDEPFEIGHCPDGGLDPDRYFGGIIDEVRISGMASSADWIKLCYMNQKQQDALVKW